jgi:hypothetical protein
MGPMRKAETSLGNYQTRPLNSEEGRKIILLLHDD